MRMVFSGLQWHILDVYLRMKTIVLLGLAAFLISGCASTDEGEQTVKTDPRARWIVVSTNEPMSSRLMEKGDDSKVPARPASILLSPEGAEARQEIENSGIPPVLKKKMLDGEVLTVADIEDLGRYKVSEATILKYLGATGAIYILKTDDINRLQQAGVSKGVTDYMLATVKERPVQVVHRYHRYYGYYDPWWDYPPFYHHYYYYPRYYHYHHHHGGHHHGGGLRVYRPR
jgi:hypothetical protein